MVKCELTPEEFAHALALKQDSMFVKCMFKIVDTDKNGFISFREFLDMFVVLAKGTSDDKARLMFDMYDLNGDGKLSRHEFKLMIRYFKGMGPS